MKNSKRGERALKLSSVAFMKAMLPKIIGTNKPKKRYQQRSGSTISVQKEQTLRSYPGAF